MAQRVLLFLLLLAAAIELWPHAPHAEEPEVQVMRIGTGPTGGSYFPIGGVIANLISSPPGSLPCDAGGSCGVPGLIASAISTQGSVENIAGLTDGSLDMALVQADVANLASVGKGPFSNEPPHRDLRAIASLYPETVHIVVRADSPIGKIEDLRYKRVSLGSKRSGTRVSAEMILRGFGLSPSDIKPVYESLDRSSDLLADRKIDAFFMVGGYPVVSIQHAAEAEAIRLLPISGVHADELREKFSFFNEAVIPANTYEKVEATPTLSVRAQLVVDAKMRADLVHAITKVLWLPETALALSRDLPETLRIRREDSLTGLALPLHSGAERYYLEAGLLTTGAGAQ